MMQIFCELRREADIHMNHMVENQTDFHKELFSFRYANIELAKFSQELLQE